MDGRLLRVPRGQHVPLVQSHANLADRDSIRCVDRHWRGGHGHRRHRCIQGANGPVAHRFPLHVDRKRGRTETRYALAVVREQ